LNVHGARVKVGSNERYKEINSNEVSVSFEFNLDEGEYTIKADLLDNRGEILTSAYYLKIREI
jgi:hypothetical protein